MTEKIGFMKFIAAMEEFGITDRNFLAPLFQQLIEVDGFGGDGVEFAAAVIKGVKPRDQLEAMHAAQMAMMHWTAMHYIRQAVDYRETPEQQLAVNAATKLARTYAGHMDALKRYRSGGSQTITVQHVSVADGGKAIVGSVTHNPAEPAPTDGAVLQSRLLTDRQDIPMETLEQRADLLPVPVSQPTTPKKTRSKKRTSREAIDAILGRCSRVRAAALKLDPVSPVDRPLWPARTAAVCTAEHRDRGLRVVIRMR
jgi:hypothetical protein